MEGEVFIALGTSHGDFEPPRASISPQSPPSLKPEVTDVLYMDRVKQIWYLSPMPAVKVQASLRIHAVSPQPPLLAHTSSESRGIFRQKARSLAPLNGWACAVKICHDGMLEDTNSLHAAHMGTAISQQISTVKILKLRTLE